jgi:acyl-CoA synthetase (AMP-forming)/AMP-acid ligase II
MEHNKDKTMSLAGIYGRDDFAPRRIPAATKPLSSRAARILPTPSVEWTPEVERETAHLYERVKTVIPSVEWPFMAPYVKAINDLKKERNAVILAHNYQTPEIFHCVSDIVGDSLQLAREATKVDADVIVQCGVHFMAETSKILSPDKTVLIPDSRAGCSLASSITGEDVRLLRDKFPGVPVVAYVNTSADVKAEVDICCTSSNAVQVVESLGVDKVIFVPDQYLARYVASQTKVKIIAWKGACEVHERFTERFGVLIHELYGMSETGGWNTMNLPVHEKFGGNVGKVREGFDVRVFDGEDNELPAGTAGEIVIRPNKPFLMFNGYYKRHEETIRDFRNLWFHTGDMGMTDEDGYFYFLGRMKENIRRGGENISPLEIDKVILEHPAVSEVAAVGVSDEIMGEEIKVYIVTKPGESVSAEEIISICQQRLASFMVPRYVEFTSALPKTGSEKIQRGELKKLGVGQAFDRLSDVS